MKRRSVKLIVLLALVSAVGTGLGYPSRANQVVLNNPTVVKDIKNRATDNLDPDDCSRGIDESNEESCAN